MTAITPTRRTDLDPYLLRSGAVSLALHLFLLLFLLRPVPDFERTPQVIDVSFEPVSVLQPQKRQIVSPSQRSLTTEPPANTRYLSDRDSTVEREQIKRGDGPEAGPVVQPEKAGADVRQVPPAQKPPRTQESAKTTERASLKENFSEPAPPRKRNATPLKHLALDNKTLLKKFGKSSKPQPASPNQFAATQPTDLSSTRPFSRPRGSGARFLGTAGSSDFLPNLPDGDITLLNTKAGKFAVFVRRVATQVFGQLRSSGWDSLRASDVRRMTDFTTVRAVLSKQGELLEVSLISPSGSRRFDEVVVAATKIGAKDPNPPATAAAADGNIRFIFKARSWSRFVAGRNGGSERRWLLLATGLE